MMMMMIFHACLQRTKDLCGTMHWDFLDNLPVRVTSISYSSYFKNFYFSCKRKIWISGLEILLSTERQTGEWSLTIWDALSNRKLGLGAWLRPRLSPVNVGESDYLQSNQSGMSCASLSTLFGALVSVCLNLCQNPECFSESKWQKPTTRERRKSNMVGKILIATILLFGSPSYTLPIDNEFKQVNLSITKLV